MPSISTRSRCSAARNPVASWPMPPNSVTRPSSPAIGKSVLRSQRIAPSLGRLIR